MSDEKTQLLNDIYTFMIKSEQYRSRENCENFLMGAGISRVFLEPKGGPDKYLRPLIRDLMEKDILESFLLQMQGEPNDRSASDRQKIQEFIDTWQKLQLRSELPPVPGPVLPPRYSAPSTPLPTPVESPPSKKSNNVERGIFIGAAVATIIAFLITIISMTHGGSSSSITIIPTNTPFVTSTLPNPTATSSPTITDTPTPSFTITPTIPHSLQILLSEPAPDCNDPSGATWIKPFGENTTSITCNGSSMTMLQPLSSSYAEINLETAMGQNTYNQSDFQAQVTVTVPAGDTSGSNAALIVQTPVGTDINGYSLTLTAQGVWEQQQWIPNQKYPSVVHSGSVTVTGPMTLLMVVHNGTLTTSINGVSVGPSIPDSLTTGVVGLMVQSPTSNPNVPFTFANFSLRASSLS